MRSSPLIATYHTSDERLLLLVMHNEERYWPKLCRAPQRGIGTNLQVNSRLFSTFSPVFSQPPSGGALPSLFAATSPDATGGRYCGPGGRFEWKSSPKQVESTRRSHDTDVAARPWQVSEDLTGVKFPL